MRVVQWMLVAAAVLMGGRGALAESSLSARIRAAIAAAPHAQTVAGVCVIDLATGVTVFTHNADRPMIPASNMKVFTMASALLELGQDFAFETVLATNGTDLYLIGDGDPALGDEKLCDARGESIYALFERWAEAITTAGITGVQGDLVIDESIFDDVRVHPTWEDGDLGKWYAAPVGGLNFNDNCLDITVSPAAAGGVPALVSIQPENSLARIINHCKTGGPRNKSPLLHHPPGTFEYRISGRCHKRWRFGPVAFPDPGLLTADSLRTVLARKGISIAGEVRRERVRQDDGTFPATLKVLARHHTPLTDVLARTGKDSQNLFAEALLKRTGYAWSAGRSEMTAEGSWTMGGRAVIDILNRTGLNTEGLVVADGSGLSRENRCTARQLAATLHLMHHSSNASVFRESLSVAGQDGSLRRRLRNATVDVYGKTGTMRGIRTLSGYVGRDGMVGYAFAVLFNGYQGPSTPYREIQDRICVALGETIPPSRRDR